MGKLIAQTWSTLRLVPEYFPADERLHTVTFLTQTLLTNASDRYGYDKKRGNITPLGYSKIAGVRELWFHSKDNADEFGQVFEVTFLAHQNISRDMSLLYILKLI